MKIKYINTKSDVESAIHSLYINSFIRISVLFSLFFILVVSITLVKDSEPSLGIFYFLLAVFLIIFFRFYLIPIIKFKRDFKKQTEISPNSFSEEIFCVKEDGFEVKSERYNNETQFFNWQSIKYAYSTVKYYLIILHNDKMILINKTNADPKNILPNIIGIIEANRVNKKRGFYSNQQKNKIQNDKKIYWFGLLGIIPNIGLLVGMVLSIIGIVRRDLKLIFIGIADIVFTVIFWIVFAQISESDFISKSFEKPNSEMTKTNLNELVKHIEFYKTANGEYPENLKQIENNQSFVFIYEIFASGKSKELYYKKEKDHYILKSCGPDEKIDTYDDIYPTLKIDSTKIGLRKKI